MTDIHGLIEDTFGKEAVWLVKGFIAAFPEVVEFGSAWRSRAYSKHMSDRAAVLLAPGMEAITAFLEKYNEETAKRKADPSGFVSTDFDKVFNVKDSIDDDAGSRSQILIALARLWLDGREGLRINGHFMHNLLAEAEERANRDA